MPWAEYMQSQKDITPRMRSILNDWLVDVYRKYGLRRETLFLSVSIIDRYLSQRQVGRARLQLVGTTAMLVAAKFEEVDPPDIAEMVHVTDHTYSRQEVLDMEVALLNTLGFEVASPTAAHFLLHFQAAANSTAAVGNTNSEVRSNGNGTCTT